jgi:AraC-like DNA-binding protein
VIRLRICQWKDLLEGNYQFSHIYSKMTRPQFTVQGNTSRPRIMHGIVLYLSGSAILEPESSGVKAEAGTLLYYPANACYRAIVSVPQTCYNQVEFTITDAQGCPVTLSEQPFVLFKDCPAIYRLKIADMVRVHNQGGLACTIKLNALLYDLMYNLVLEKFIEESKLSGYQRILPSILFLEQHFIEKIPIEQLAQLSNMSVTGFRKLFRKYSGLSPLAYRNNLRIRRAYDLLRSGEHNVSEAADLTGFGNVFYFSRVFRQITGYAPSDILHQQTGEVC